MKYSRLVLGLLCSVMALSSCKSQFELLLESDNIDEKYSAAFDLYNNGKYNKAINLFESLSTQVNGTSKEDTVFYYLGLSHYRYRDFYSAETTFTHFVTNFMYSPFIQEATFYRLDCMYRSTYRYELDQKPTSEAITAINSYIKDYPSTPYMVPCQNMLTDLNERLDRKAFENAKLYYKMEDYKAATVALRNVLKDDSENIYREDILYYLALSSYEYAQMSIPAKQKERYLIFEDDYLNFIGEYPDSDYRKGMDSLHRKSQRALGKAGAYDDEEEI